MSNYKIDREIAEDMCARCHNESSCDGCLIGEYVTHPVSDAMTDRIIAGEIGEAFDGSCPVCKHDAFRVHLDRLHRPESPRYVVTCIKCGESGDFLDVNDYIYNSLNRIRSFSSELEKAKAEAERLRRPLKRLRTRVIQMGIETASLKRQRDELEKSVAFSKTCIEECDFTICKLCKRVNPHHANCDSCQDRDDIKSVISMIESVLNSLGSGE
jgi:hypothetical protein